MINTTEIRPTPAAAADERLHDALSRLQLALDAAGIGTFTQRFDGTPNAADARALTLFGLDPQRWRGDARSIIARIHPDDWPRVEREGRRAFERRAPYETEFRVMRPDGGVRWLLLRGALEHDEASGRARLMRGVVVDITERRTADEQRRAAAARLALAMDAALLYSWQIDADSRRVVWSDNAARVLGLPPESLPETLEAAQAMWHPDDAPHAERALRQALDGTTSGVAFELRLQHPLDRRVIWVQVQGIVESVHGGRVRRVVGVSQNITRRKTLEHELRASEERFRATFDDAPLGISQTATDGTLLDVNDAYCRIVGRRRDELLGARFESITHPDDRPRNLALFHDLLAGRVERYEMDKRYLRPDGSVVWTHLTGSAVRGAGGAVKYGIAIIDDITEDKRAQDALAGASAELRAALARLTATFDNAAVGITDIALDGRPLRVNQRLCQILGYSREELLAETFVDITHPDDLKTDWAQAQRLIAGEIDHYEREKRYLRRDGSSVWVHLTVGLVRKPDGTPDFFVSMLEDIDARKRLEAERERHLAALKEADRRKDEFLAMLAHELRNPLAPIRNAVAILRATGPAEPALEKPRAMIERQVAHLTRLVDDLLDVSRVTQGKVLLKKQVLDMAVVIGQAVELVRPFADAKHHALAITLPPPGVLWVEGDATRLAQAIGNLLDNAAKYTPEGGAIALTGAIEDGRVVVRVRDNGIGIETGLMPVVFELFTQAERSLDRAQGGLGIGLALVKSLVALHAGEVGVESDGAGRGSTFTVSLPLAAAPAPAPATTPEAAAGGGKRVLLVDDNVDAADSLALLLSMQGHVVRTAHDGPSALAQAPEFAPQVCLLDIGLPRMDGYELARRLRALPAARDAMYVALTGYGRAEERSRALDAGFDHHLIKPVDPDTLFALLGGG